MEKGIIFVKEGAEGYYEEKKSKFIAGIYAIENEEQALSIIEKTRKKYWDARHNCYAFVAGDNNELTRCSDDGEPSGTAGKPILEVILNKNIHNCLIIVTRYFGGTLLGTGGLVRAYQKASIDGLEKSELGCRIKGSRFIIATDYNSAGKIQYMAGKKEYIIEDIVYGAGVEIYMAVLEDKAAQAMKDITEITAGKADVIEEKGVDIIVEA